MTARLPVPGNDDGTWGTILNQFLQVSHNGDGTLQTSAMQGAGAITSVNGKTPSGTSGSVTLAASDVSAVASSSVGSANGVASLNSSGVIPTTQLGTGTSSGSDYLRGDGIWAVPASGSSTLSGDTDVSISSPSNNQVLTYNSSSSKWMNQTPLSAPVSSVFGRTGTVTAQSGDYSAAEVGALPSTDDLSAIANANATAGNVSMSSHKITNLTNGSNAQDAVAFGQLPSTSAPLPLNQGGTGVSAASDAALLSDLGAAPMAGATFTGYVSPAVNSLTFGSSIAINAALGNVFSLTLTASTGTLANPTNPLDGQVIRIRVTQGTGGNFTLAYGSAYDFGAAGSPTLSTTASKVDELSFGYNASLSKWCYFGSGLGF